MLEERDARIAVLEAALEPFARAAAGREWMPDYYGLWIRLDDDSGMGMLDITIADLRRAAAAYPEGDRHV